MLWCLNSLVATKNIWISDFTDIFFLLKDFIFNVLINLFHLLYQPE